jgi:hypothetical protein
MPGRGLGNPRLGCGGGLVAQRNPWFDANGGDRDGLRGVYPPAAQAQIRGLIRPKCPALLPAPEENTGVDAAKTEAI